MLSTDRLLRLGFPVALMIACAFLWRRIAVNAGALDAVPNAVGPAGWPRAMIIGLALFALLHLITELLQWRSAIRMGRTQVDVPAGDDEDGNQRMALVGIAVIVAYGFAIPIIGFTFATALFIAIWCALGRVRPLTITLVSLIGTVVLLYMFVALAKMPLDRGEGQFGMWTVSLYRLLHIY